ncbi:MAG: TetR/AcrR family transcriptional regulator [Chloroflexota bacterium]
MSPRRAEQNEAMRAEARARIMEAALLLFSQHGYDQTSVRMIAQQAGVSQGLMYNYFASKEELLVEIFRASMRDVRESFAQAAAAGPEDRVETLIRAAFTIIRRNQSFWRLSYASRMQPSVLAVLQPEIQPWTGEILQTIERYLSEAGVPDPQIEARILFALIDGVCQHFVLDPEGYPLSAVVETLVARYRTLTERAG